MPQGKSVVDAPTTPGAARTYRMAATPLAAALIVLAVTLLYLSLRISVFERALPVASRPYAVSLFVIATRGNADPGQTPPGLLVLPGRDDYDGEYFYRLALDPLTTRKTAFGLTLDNPAYRQQRLLYPLLAWALSGGGRPLLLPWAMLAINVAAVGALAGLAGAYARDSGHSPLWGVVPALYPGFALSLAVDTAEPLAICLFVATLLLARRGQFAEATLCLTLAVLTRETSLFIAFAAVLVWLWARLTGKAEGETKAPLPAFFFGIPMAVYALWRLVQMRVWGAQGLRLHNINLPGLGLLRFVRLFARSWTPTHLLWLAEIVFLVTLGVATLCALRPSRARPLEKVTWLLFAALATLLSRAVWNTDSAFLRVLFEFSVLAFLILMQSPLRIQAPLAAASVALWLLVAAHVLASGMPLRHSIFESRRAAPPPPSPLPRPVAADCPPAGADGGDLVLG